jgi:hypothetical protein
MKKINDPNRRLLSLVLCACYERYEVLCLRPFMVRTPSISHGRGRHIQVYREGISDRGLALAGASDPKRTISLSRYQHLDQKPEVINFHHMIDLEYQDETNVPPLESSKSPTMRTIMLDISQFLYYKFSNFMLIDLINFT